MVDDQSKRDRSPSFPYIGLSKGIERVQVIFDKAKRHEVRVADIAKDWGLAPKSSSTDRNVAALLAYGLVDDVGGGGENKKIKISERGWRIVDDKRPGVREKFLSEAALSPRTIAEYVHKWADGRPDDSHALSQLKFEGGFTEDGARLFLRVFDDTIRFAEVPEKQRGDDSGAVNPPQTKQPKLGDLVQWTNNGVDQLNPPLPVVAISEDGLWLWVEGSQTALPLAEVQILANAPSSPPSPPPEVLAAMSRAQPSLSQKAGMQRDMFSLDEGTVTIEFPDGLKPDSVDELEEFFQLFIKKARRRAKLAAG